MALSIQNFTKVNTNPQSAFVNMFTANGHLTNDNAAAMRASGYFNNVAAGMSIGDLIYCVASDANQFLSVVGINTATNPPTVTTSTFTGTTPVGTADITDLAVTGAKIDNATIAAAKMVANTIDSGQTALSLMQHVRVTLSSANILAMQATPVQILAAAGSGSAYIIDSWAVDLIFNTIQYANGGNVGLQYGATASLGGTAASVVIANTTVNAAASTAIRAAGALASTAVSTLNNAAITISSPTAFITGNSTATVDVWYRKVVVA